MVLTRSGVTSDGGEQQSPTANVAVAGERDALMSASGEASRPPQDASPPHTAGPSGASTSAALLAQSPTTHAVTMTDQQLAHLLQMVRATATSPAPPEGAVLSGNFAACSSRFDGAKASDVLAFIDAIEIYKECVGIADHIALRGLPMLLTGLAATWWQGVKASVPSWSEAVELLKQTYGPRLPRHRIYREIFKREQGEEPTDIFVCKLRALFAQLPPTALSEDVQLDMVYGLLHKRIREKVYRGSFGSFSELLTKARCVEDILEEGRGSQYRNPMKEPTLTDENTLPPASSSNRSVRARCNYCKQYGHLKDDCPRLTAKKIPANKIKKEMETESHSTLITCFGCGAPGVVRSKCPTCKEKNTVTTSSAFQCVATFGSKLIDSRQRPILNIEIYGASGSALLDTGAKQSVASESLYAHLVAHGHKFDKTATNVTLADGSNKYLVVDVAKVDVKVVHGLVVSTLFIVLPGATESLLGMNFIRDAGMVLDFNNQCFSFASISRKYPLSYEKDVGRLTCSAIELREDEASTLTPPQRRQLSDLLTKNEDMFEPGGASTTFAVHRIDTGNHAPVSVPPYRVSPLKKELMRKEIDKMLAEGVIEEAESEWASPVVMVPKTYGDKGRRPPPNYKVGDLVLVDSHIVSNAEKGITQKFAPKRLGPFKIAELVSPTTFKVVDNKGNVIKYHASALTPYRGISGIIQSKKRGRPSVAKSSSRPSQDLEGENIAPDTSEQATTRPGAYRQPNRIRRRPARYRDL